MQTMRLLARAHIWMVILSCATICLPAQEEFKQWHQSTKAILTSREDGLNKEILIDLVSGKEKELKGQLADDATSSKTKSSSSNVNVTLRDHDLVLIYADGSEKQLTYDQSIEKNATFSDDKQQIAYTKDNDLYVFDLASESEKRLTHDGSESVYNGWASWVYYEEILGRRSRYSAFWWSPDSKHIAFLHFDDSPVPQFTLFRSAGAHGDLEVNHYPKAGDPNPNVKFGVVNTQTGGITWMEEQATKDQYSALPFWTPDGKYLLFQEVNRGQDTLRLVKANPKTGARKVIYEETQPTWVEFFEELYFLDNNDFILRSNKDGWYNLYRYDLDGQLVAKITEANFRISEIVEIDEASERIFLYGTGASSVNQHFFVADLRGGGLRQLTHQDGWHAVKLSPNYDFFYDRYSSLSDPGGAYLASTKGEVIRTINIERNTPNENSGVKVEPISVPTSDGFELPGYWVLPKNFNPENEHPVLFSIYGGPDAGTVRNRYRSYADNFFSNNGVILFVMDHRASGKFGKKGLDYMHRSLGKWELNDYIEGVKWLRQKHFVDRDRVGITGGSYGGYMTALALTQGADYFTHGVSLFPVTDWRLYDNVYTERYMDKPEENVAGYDYGSAIVHADKLKGKLLIVHGMMDDNVHMQNTMQFISALQDLNKDFEMMVYPGERHGWGGPKRRHLTKITNGFWRKHFISAKKTSGKLIKP